MTTEDLIMKYAIGLHKRFSAKQKQMFIRVAAKDFNDLGYAVKANTGKHKRMRSINLMVGDVKQAETLIVANYDTPQHNFGNPMKYYPFNGVTTFVSGFLPIYAPMIIGGVLMLYILMQQMPYLNFTTDVWWSLFWLGLFIVCAVFTPIMTMGIGNKVNFNRNTSGVVAALRLAEELSKEQRKKVAFVFTDNGCRNHGGDYLLRESFPDLLDDKLVIMLDCVGDGDTLVIGYKDDSVQEAKDLAACFKVRPKRHLCPKEDLRYTSFSFYPRGLLLARGNFYNDVLMVENISTNKDTNCDVAAIDELVAGLKKYCSHKPKHTDEAQEAAA